MPLRCERVGRDRAYLELACLAGRGLEDVEELGIFAVENFGTSKRYHADMVAIGSLEIGQAL